MASRLIASSTTMKAAPKPTSRRTSTFGISSGSSVASGPAQKFAARKATTQASSASTSRTRPRITLSTIESPMIAITT